MVKSVCLDEAFHNNTMMVGLNKLRIDKDLCDFAIKVGKEEYPVHKNVISVASEYFRAMLKHDTQESRSGQVDMKDVSSECVKNCLDYIYTAKFDIPDGKSEDMLYAARLLQLHEVSNAVTDFLKESLCVENFYSTRQIAILFSLANLLSECESFERDHLIQLSEQAEFKKESITRVQKILQSQDVILTEEEKLIITINWVDHDSDKKLNLLNLLKLIKLEEVPVKFLWTLLRNNPIFSDNFILYKMVNEALMDRNPLLDIESSDDRKALILFDNSSDSLKVIDPASFEVRKFHDVTFKEFGTFTAVVLYSHIYILCGNKSVYRFNYKRQNVKWKRMPDMIGEHGERLAVATLHGALFVIGTASHFGNPSNVVEKFDHHMCQWVKLQDKPEAVEDAALVSLNDSIYCIGGWDGKDCINSFCKFTPSTAQWINLEPMRSAKEACGTAAVDQKIFVFGGETRDKFLNEVDRYEVTTRQWSTLSPMTRINNFVIASPIGGLIYTIARNSKLDTLAKYDILNDEWHEVDLQELTHFQVYDMISISS